MNKDVIYIDVEDDITAIISKVKASKEKIVALVPPKRVGVLQSAVNLRLLHRAAKQANKRLVLITNNHALMSLAASASLPVAKNLQSKPELAEVSVLEIDDGEDVIDGNDLPVGDHAKQGKADDDEAAAVAAISAELAKPPAENAIPKKIKPKKGMRVPNFNTFRKKMIAGIVALIALIAFLVWAIVIAPHASVIVSAKTDNSSINTSISVSDSAKTNAAKNTIKAVLAKDSADTSLDFTATGTKNVGEKASGTVQFSQQSQTETTVSSGTKLKTSQGLIFVTQDDVTVPKSDLFGPGCFPTACPGTATVTAAAEEGGAKYNAASGDLSGAPSGVSARFDSPTSGGTDKVAKVVTVADVQKAKQALVDKDNKDVVSGLKASFEGDVVTLAESFAVDYDEIKPTPNIGEEATDGKAVLSGTVNYRLYAIERSEISTFLDSYLKKEIGETEDRRVYSNGVKKVTIQDINATKNGATATLIATAKVGPKLDEANIKNLSKGKRFGDIQEAIESIQGVENVDVKFFPFWISTVPDDVKRISVEFKVDDSK